jgi:hypothetical protein
VAELVAPFYRISSADKKTQSTVEIKRRQAIRAVLNQPIEE